MSLPEYTTDEVAEHNTAEDCWVILTNDDNEEFIYDFTPFLRNHPGGASAIMAYAGKNGDISFRRKEIHYNYGKERLPPYLIGRVKIECGNPTV